jgi:undecaprenyl-diphosphatase
VEWLQIIVLALIQGITEFLPISSSAHLILPGLLTDWPDQGLAFDIAVHLGSLIAVIAYFRRDMVQFADSGLRLVTGQGLDQHGDELLKVAAATLPVVVAGFLLKGWVETELRSVLIIASTTIGFGLLLGYADHRHGHRTTLSWRDAMIVGSMQVLAIIPGTSRSGITITAALLLGLSRVSGARFSFLLSIPTIAGASLLAAMDLLQAGTDTDWGPLAAGALISGTAAYLCIATFIRLVERTGMMPYVIYRLLLGTALLTLWATTLHQTQIRPV